MRRARGAKLRAWYRSNRGPLGRYRRAGERFRDPAHPYAEDLDLFGKGGLFELLSTARTRGGEDTLARWMLESAAPEIVIERQAAVAECGRSWTCGKIWRCSARRTQPGAPEALIAWSEARRPSRRAARESRQRRYRS